MTVRTSIKTAQSSFPAQGNRELPWTYDFTNVALINDDLGPEMQTSQIDTVQSIYIDNSLNGSAFNIAFNAIYNINVLPGRQGVYPVMASGLIKIVAQSAGAVKVPVIFSNTQKSSYAEWGAP
jgi:hypothetical protein